MGWATVPPVTVAAGPRAGTLPPPATAGTGPPQQSAGVVQASSWLHSFQSEGSPLETLGSTEPLLFLFNLRLLEWLLWFAAKSLTDSQVPGL